MSLPIRRHLVILAVLGAGGCSAPPTPGDADYPFNLDGRYASDMVVRETSYRGSIDLATAHGGKLVGSMQLVAPIPITAQLSGQVRGDSIAFGGPYRTPECTGVLRGRGRIADGGRTAWGDVSIDDGCVGAMRGSFRLAK